MTEQRIQVTCRSVFQQEEDEMTTERFTKMWIALINQVEQSKGRIAALR